MSRLIDADVLLRKICADSCGCEPDECGYIDEYRKERCKAGQYIDNAPTVDAVPVVRCSECKHYKSVLCPLSMADGYYWPAHNPDFFCADGERREQDGTR